ncbi:MAG: riboflavin synthase [Cyanobacteria bacterium HKST-UBA04]|nr:riboflavin synthase [Cyanobacteria bacterium HKST-UBA05]MCA9798132.1 riboflavin synthase [Cyanobacteria bacterium HKST-UBA04]MCA9841013.1 riboflavin synthase [Cyanobacteria bacterium HKST-UBA03]
MFTGLIETVGTLLEAEDSQGGMRFVVEAAVPSGYLADVAVGESIAIDGVCTTVVSCDGKRFAFEASPETLRKTTFGQLKPGVSVNLERALLPTTRLGGHFVSGHIEGTAVLKSRMSEGNAKVLAFELEQPELALYVIEKGSIALSGISLTVNTIDEATLTVAIIPHTLEQTNLGCLQVGQRVNVETDMVGKYVHKLLGAGKAPQVVWATQDKEGLSVR